jgi:hypothetical protein
MTRLLLVVAVVCVAGDAGAQTLSAPMQLPPGFTHLVVGRVGPPRPVNDIVVYRADTGAFAMVVLDHPMYPVWHRVTGARGDCVEHAGVWPVGVDSIVYAGNMSLTHYSPLNPKHRWVLLDSDSGRVWTYDVQGDGVCMVAAVSPREDGR